MNKKCFEKGEQKAKEEAAKQAPVQTPNMQQRVSNIIQDDDDDDDIPNFLKNRRSF